MNSSKSTIPHPQLQRSSGPFDDLMIAVVRGIDFVSSQLRQPWSWRRVFGGGGGSTESQVSPNNNSTPERPAKTPPDGRRKRVLLVEGESLTRLILVDKLRRAGLEVDVAQNVSIALQKLKSSFPDGVFMELIPGGIQATEIIKEARRDPKFAKRPIYVYTCQTFNGAQNPTASLTGASRVFSKLATAADEAVKELASELIGRGARAARAAAVPLDESESATLKELPGILRGNAGEIHGDLSGLAKKAGDAESRTAKWKDLRNRVRSLVSCAAVSGARELARQAAAMEAFLKDLSAEPDHVSNAQWATICSASEVLDALSANPSLHDQSHPAELNAVVVDDSADARVEACNALLLAGFKPANFVKPAQALKHLGSHKADLLVVDVALGDIRGFCNQVCQQPLQENLCVLFVNRSEIISEPPTVPLADLLIQPFTSAELGLRALTLVQRRITGQGDTLQVAASTMDQTLVSAELAEAATETSEAVEWPQDESGQEDDFMQNSQSKKTIQRHTAIEGLAEIPDLFVRGNRSADAAPTGEHMVSPGENAAENGHRVAASNAVHAAPEAQPDEIAQFSIPMSKPPIPQQVDPQVNKDQEVVMERAYANELEIHRLGSRLEQEAEIRNLLEARIHELMQARTALEEKLADQTRSHEELQKSAAAQARAGEEQVERAALTAAEKAREAEEQRCLRLERSLADLQQKLDEATNKLSAGQQAIFAAEHRSEKLAEELHDRAADLENARKELEHKTAEFARVQTEQKSLQAALRHEPAPKVTRQAELDDLDRRIRESVAALAQATADLEQERGERHRVEQRAAALTAQLQSLHQDFSRQLESERLNQERINELQQQIREREIAVAAVRAELRKEATDRQTAEQQVREAGDLKAQLQSTLSLYEEARRMFKNTQDDLEGRLHTSLSSLSEAQGALLKETAERRNLAESLDAAQREFQQQAQRNAMELSKLQSALQLEEFERKRMEGDVLRLRQVSNDSSRSGRAQFNNLCRQARHPLDHLYTSARQLLQAELQDEQKKLVQTMLENALLLQGELAPSEESQAPQS